jgi:uncharacterized protein (TIGR00661 family)
VFENKFENKVILIAALDWGLGHATRCVPIIRELKQKNQIIIACTETQKQFFDSEFPDLEKVYIAAYNISYSSFWPLTLKLFFQSPRIWHTIRLEHKQLKDLIKQHKVDLVISDNRFGFHSNLAYSIYITHQIQIKAGIFSLIANRIHHQIMARFQEIWVPDYENDESSLAGELSRNRFGIQVKYIQPLSRLKKTCSSELKYDYLCLLSGPEPQRTVIETILYNKAIQSHQRIAIVRGTKQVSEKLLAINRVEVYDMPDAALLSQLICSSRIVICRSGYSSLMDLHILGKDKLILIPTSGQTEQEYLAHYWKETYHSRLVLQEKLDEFDFQ